MMRAALVLRGSALALASLLLAACAGSSATPLSDNEAGYVAGDGSALVLPEGERQPAPAIAGPTLDGATWSLADQQGQVVVANVWASWCAPCRAEAPVLQQTYLDFQDQGVTFVGIDTRDSDAAAQAFVNRYGITYPNLVDPDGQLQLAFRETLPPQAIPSTVIIDAEGRVAARILGEVDPTVLAGILSSLVAEAQP